MTVRLAETFTISRGSEDEAEVIQVEVVHEGVSGFGEAAPIERYDESAASGLAWLEQVAVGDDPFALDEIEDALPPGEHAARAALDACASRPAGQADRAAGLQAPRRSACGAADLMDDLARRPRRHGPPHREDRRARLQAAQAEARRPRRARRRARCRSARRHRAAAAVRRQRGLDARRGARVPAADGAAVLRAAAASPATRTAPS